MLGNRTGPQSLNGMRRKRGGIGTLVIILLVGRKKVKVTNISVPSKKGPAKLKSASKSKPATPWLPIDAPPASRTRGSKRKTTPHPAFAAERRVSYL